MDTTLAYHLHMGAMNTGLYAKEIAFYTWSTPQFPVEHALVKVTPADESKIRIFRLSANRDKVLFRHADNTHDKEHPLRFHLEVTAHHDRGDFNFGQVIGVVGGTRSSIVQISDRTVFSPSHYEVTSKRDPNVDDVRLKKTSWELSHGITTFDCFGCSVSIRCNKVTGLEVKFVHTPTFALKIEQEPPKAFTAMVDTKFRRKEYTLYKREKKGNQNHPEENDTIINNIGGTFHGNGCGSIFQNCTILRKYETD